MSTSVNSFLQGRIDVIMAKITALDNAMLALSSGAIQHYSLDTGQSRTIVTKTRIDRIQAVINSLMNQLVTLNARLTGCGTSAVRGRY